MIKLVAFDWNGTILSDTFACVEAENASLKTLGFKSISVKEFQDSFEIPVINYYKKIGVNLSLPKSRFTNSEAIFHTIYEKRAAKARTRAGARELFTWLLEHNVKSVIFSNHITDRIFDHLTRLKIAKYFDKVIANKKIGEVFLKRGKEEKLKAYLKKNKVHPSEVLVVGDTIEEIEIAKSFGGISVALTDGYNSTKRLKNAKPDYLLRDLRQIETIITKINPN